MASKKKSKKSGMCPCGHELTWHTGPNRSCEYGHLTVTGGCPCLGYRSKKYREDGIFSSPMEAESIAKHGDLDAHLERIERRLDRLDRVMDAIGDVIDAAFDDDEPVVIPSRKPKPPVIHIETTARTIGNKPYPNKAKIIVGVDLSKCEQSILDTIAAWKPRTLSVNFISIYTGYSLKSGSFASALAGLRKRLFITGDAQHLTVTYAGARYAHPEAIAIYSEGLLEMWKRKLDKCSATILEYLYDAHPHAHKASTIAKDTDYSVSSGSFASSLAKLRTLELIQGKNASLSLHPAFQVPSSAP